jgi:plasmid maintenance system antidote protein VapI
MNRKLKGKIVERFGCQADFAQMAKVDESVVSRVIHGRRNLPEDEKARWAKILKTGKEVFQNG